MQLLGVVGAYLNSHEQLAHELYTLNKKGTKAVTGAVPFQKGTLLYLKVAYWYLSCTF